MTRMVDSSLGVTARTATADAVDAASLAGVGGGAEPAAGCTVDVAVAGAAPGIISKRTATTAPASTATITQVHRRARLGAEFGILFLAVGHRLDLHVSVVMRTGVEVNEQL